MEVERLIQDIIRTQEERIAALELTAQQAVSEAATYRNSIDSADAEIVRLKGREKVLVEAISEARGHLADYSRRTMFGSECDQDVKAAQLALRAVLLSEAQPVPTSAEGEES